VLYLFTKLHNYHINYNSLLIIFEETDYYRGLRKAGAVPGWSPLLEEVGRRLDRVGFSIHILLISSTLL
jgi:hypothetical protein